MREASRTAGGDAPPAERKAVEGGQDGAGTGLVGLEEVRAAASRLGPVVRRTPLHPTALSGPGPGAPGAANPSGVANPSGADSRPAARPGPGARDGGPPVAWLKCENLQHVSAFKVRGAYYFVSRLPEERRRAGLVTYSSGNHAQGVAFAARAFGLRALVVMPVDAPEVKVERTRALGAEVEQVGTTTLERQARAEEIVRRTGATMVPPFDHPDVIAGQGTVGLEIVEQLESSRGWPARDGPRRPALVAVPVGGGGLISGVAAAVRGSVPAARVVGVEPEGAASMKASLEAGRTVALERAETIADGLKPVAPGNHTFRHCRALVERVVTVTDEEIRRAVLWLFREGLVAEPSGAAAVAALLSGCLSPAPEEEGATVAVVSGGNVDPRVLRRWLAA